MRFRHNWGQNANGVDWKRPVPHEKHTSLHVFLQLFPSLFHLSRSQCEDLLRRECRHHVAAIFLLYLLIGNTRKGQAAAQTSWTCCISYSGSTKSKILKKKKDFFFNHISVGKNKSSPFSQIKPFSTEEHWLKWKSCGFIFLRGTFMRWITGLFQAQF